MGKELRILILEDSPADAELEEHELRQSGLVCALKVVDTKAAFLKALEEFSPDIILSDYDLPTFDGLAALRIAKENCPNVPFILVTGKVGEEFAIEKLKEGATDYVLKGNLKRLVPSVTRALEEAQERAERKKLEEALRVSEEKWRNLFNQAADLIITIDLQGNIVDLNKRFEEESGWNRKEMIGKNVLTCGLITDESVRKVSFHLSKIIQGQESPIFEIEGVRKDGEIVPYELSANPIIHDEKITAIQAILRNTTERKKAEEALRTSEAELHDSYFVQSAINLILSTSLEELSLEEFLQKSLNMILSVPWISFQSIGSIFLVEDDPEILVMKAQLNMPEPLKELCKKVPFGKYICGKAALSQQVQFTEHIDETNEICCEGMSPHGHCAVPILFGGNTLGVINIYLNEGHITNEKEIEFLLLVADSLSGIITRKRAEESLRQNELYLKTIMASIQAGVMVIDADKHKIVDVNDIASKLIGAPKEQIIGRICHEYVCPAEKGKCPITDLNQVIDNAERTLIDINEKKIPIIKTVVPLTFQNRTYLLESFIDITERKQAEQQIAIFKKFAEESSLAYGFADLNGDIFYINATLCRILGLEKPEDALGTNVAIYYPDNMKSKLLNEVLPIVKSKGGWAGDMPLQSIKGKVTPTIQNISLIRDDKGKPLYIGNIITDITERKKSEAELQERVKELEDFYHMAVGRELRMKELKEEMRELREELEKYKKQ